MTNLELATTFPEAKSILKQLCQSDKEMLANYWIKEREVKNKMLSNIKTIAHADIYTELIMLMYSNLKHHVIKQGKEFNQILNCEDRLKKNEQILGFLNNKSHPQALDWLTQIARAKTYPISQLLEFNRAGFAKCLWHDEKEPSLKYYQKDNRIHCFSCGRDDDAIGVVQHTMKLSFKESIQWLISMM